MTTGPEPTLGQLLRRPGDDDALQTGAVTSIDSVIDRRLVSTSFQPIVHLATGEVVAYEAFARGPVGGPFESPVALLAAAASIGRLAELDWVCAASACAAALEARLHPSISVFLNFEPGTLLGPCPEDLLSYTRRALDHLRVVVEVKGDSLVADPGRQFDALSQIRDVGWGVSIKNVVESRAGLALFPLIHPDVIELDLRAANYDPRRIAEMGDDARLYAEQTGATVLATGIEDADHVLAARSAGATVGQGFYFGRPEPLERQGAVPRAVVPLLPAPSMDIRETPFEVVAGQSRPELTEWRLLEPICAYLESQVDRNGPPALLLVSLPADGSVDEDHLALLEQATARAAFSVIMTPGLSERRFANARTQPHGVGDAMAGEWDVLVLGPHYAGAVVTRGVGDDDSGPYRRLQYAVTHDRGVILRAARGFLHRVAAGSASSPFS